MAERPQLIWVYICSFAINGPEKIHAVIRTSTILLLVLEPKHGFYNGLLSALGTIVRKGLQVPDQLVEPGLRATNMALRGGMAHSSL